MNPNPMMAALQQSRQDNPVSSSGPMPGGQPQQSQSPDLAKYWSMMQEMNSKLDKVIEAISGQYTGKTPDKDGEKENNDHGSNGY